MDNILEQVNKDFGTNYKTLDWDIVPTSARAVVVTPKVSTAKGRTSALRRDQSKKRIITVHETKTPNIPSVEEYIEIVKKELQLQIQQGQY